MRVLNIGSLNIDDVFEVGHFVRPGETIACEAYERFPGGKGANQTVALARAGATVHHAGKIGEDGLFLRELLVGSGADCSRLLVSPRPTGHAIIQVDASGQNCIILFGGANHDIGAADISSFLEGWGRDDAVLLQNETSCLEPAMDECARRGLRIFFNPSPVKDNLAALPLDRVSCLILNEVEGEALSGEADPERMIGALRPRLPRTDIVLTLGDRGVRFHGAAGHSFSRPARRVEVVDTTAAGDTFTGYFIAALARGEGPELAVDEGILAASLCVSRKGASSSIPLRSEIRAGLSIRP